MKSINRVFAASALLTMLVLPYLALPAHAASNSMSDNNVQIQPDNLIQTGSPGLDPNSSPQIDMQSMDMTEHPVSFRLSRHPYDPSSANVEPLPAVQSVQLQHKPFNPQ